MRYYLAGLNSRQKVGPDDYALQSFPLRHNSITLILVAQPLLAVFKCPLFHAIYGEYVGIIDLKTLQMFEGDLPKKALTLMQEWATLHQRALQDMWENQEFQQLPPLV